VEWKLKLSGIRSKMSTIALPTIVTAKQVTVQPAEKQEDRTHLLTERLRRTLEGPEEEHVYTIDPKNHREGFKKLVKSKRAKKR
jgi:hypothetical protein